jgi:hypothetical protein
MVAIPADVPCARLYRTIRAGVPATALRLGEGRNLFPPSPLLRRWIARCFQRQLRTGRIADYESGSDRADRRLVARLLGALLGRRDLSEEHVFFVSGAQEAISVASDWAGSTGLRALLPLPLYYSFEQSARRGRLPIAGYQAMNGAIHGDASGNLFKVQVLPNAVAGTETPVSSAGGDESFTLIDAIYQLGELSSPGWLTRRLRSLAGSCDLRRTALVLTVSKDLSLPGLRAAVLVTGNRALLHHAGADRFERTYASAPLGGSVVAMYVGLLLARAMELAIVPRFSLATEFHAAGLEWFTPADLATLLATFGDMAARNTDHLRILEEAGLPLEVRLRPRAGYSTLVDLTPCFGRPAAFVEWCHTAGMAHGIKLNPAYVLGARPRVWEALYPRRSLLRINLSYPRRLFEQGLGRLARACSSRRLARG